MRRNANKMTPNESFANQRKNILGKNSSFQVQEAYKTMRANIRFMLSGNGCKRFCITSGLASEGKSITSLNLAISFAEAGHKVLLMDADLRRPSLARLLIEVATPGLSNVLAGLCNEEEAVRKSEYENLDILLSGEIPPNPSELLGSEKMAQLLDSLSRKYDYILIDTPPVGIVADACVIGSMTHGVLFLVRQNVTERDSVEQGIKQLELAGTKLLGFVLNGVDREGKKRYSNKKYKYKYKYGYGYEYGYSHVRAKETTDEA